VRVIAAAATDVGRVRANNEDAFLTDDEHGCYAVADGMGGHLGGEVASATAIEALRAAVARGVEIDEAVGIANDAVVAKAAGDPALTGMGTTLTALTLGDGAVVIGHVGDSRAYLLRAGELRMVTDDHSLVGEMIREGRLTVEQAEVHPQRSVITRCLGTGPGVQVDVIALPVVSGDRIVLCSDGLTTMLRDEAIRTLVDDDVPPADLARRLVDSACAAGGDDNVTVVVIDIADVADPSGSVPPSGVVASPTPAVPSAPSPVPPAATPGPGSRRRALLLLIAPIIVIGAAVGILGWYARGSYFIGERNGVVVIYQGVPGGVVGWNPTVREQPPPPLRVTDLTEEERTRVREETTRGSLATLRGVVAGWRTGATTRATTTTRLPPTTGTTNAVPTTRPRPPTPTTVTPARGPTSAP